MYCKHGKQAKINNATPQGVYGVGPVHCAVDSPEELAIIQVTYFDQLVYRIKNHYYCFWVPTSLKSHQNLGYFSKEGEAKLFDFVL